MTNDVINFQDKEYVWKDIDGKRCLVPYTKPKPFYDGWKENTKILHNKYQTGTIKKLEMNKVSHWVILGDDILNEYCGVWWGISAPTLEELFANIDNQYGKGFSERSLSKKV